MPKDFLSGAQVLAQTCEWVGAQHMYGYPITPATEIFTEWIHLSHKNSHLQYLQTEDEIAAGFAVCGTVLAGKLAFTATSGPGTILMQDALSMAEGMRLPFVAIVVQRGGPSSGTVIYSQQEVNLAIHGGNGEGMRIVLSPSDLEELAECTQKAFHFAWKYRFPAIVLSDGFLMKTRQSIDLQFSFEKVEATPIIGNEEVHLQNIYTFEQELHDVLVGHQKDFEIMRNEIAQCEEYQTEDATEIIIAHGLVAAAAKDAVDELRMRGKKIGLWRPITLSPFPRQQMLNLFQQRKKIAVVESSLGQLKNLIKQEGNFSEEVKGLFRPAVGIDTEEIVQFCEREFYG